MTVLKYTKAHYYQLTQVYTCYSLELNTYKYFVILERAVSFYAMTSLAASSRCYDVCATHSTNHFVIKQV